ncbi:hypothetical protein [Synoicihabitans lomoniglobus]|uniref:Uncharacterized protein n=1 Tax=Synoicihabitans lomoniglobus TaxID=2909285 RepID=A0AAF0CRD6_9BACT|nr:hypothetical protein [Opitutaceae bacterium LMO-M01]WED66668.1 hypothetical protein PXH66_07370 [Opitutaceae bacterium LMO-M01]
MCFRSPLKCHFGVFLGLAISLFAQDQSKPFRLFVGVDLLIKSPDESYRQVDSIKSDQVVLAEEGLPQIKLRDAGAFSWDRSTKISRAPIVIADFEQHRAYTLRNDKAMQYMNTQNHMAIYQQEKTDAARLERSDKASVQQAARTAQGYVDQAIKDGMIVNERTIEAVAAFNASADADLLVATDDMSDQFFETDSITSDQTFLDRAQSAASEGGHDALDLEFKISSPVPIANAYAVIMGAVTQDEEKGVITFYHPIGAVGPQPRKIKIRKTGFKPGFTIEDVQLHLYVHGKELATNLSERAIDMTREQAREFLLLSHLADHTLDTVDPEAVWTLVPATLLAAKDGASFNYPVIVNVDSDGSVISIHDSETDARAYLAEIHNASDLRSKATPGKTAGSLSEAVRTASRDVPVTIDQTGRLPDNVVAAMREMIFLPALELGVPLPGTTRVNLADFFR